MARRGRASSHLERLPGRGGPGTTGSVPRRADDAPRPRDDDVVWTASEGSLEPERFTEAVRERALFPADCDLDEKRFAALRTAAAVEGVTPSTCHLSSELRN